jgi:hypothetical protein
MKLIYLALIIVGTYAGADEYSDRVSQYEAGVAAQKAQENYVKAVNSINASNESFLAGVDAFAGRAAVSQLNCYSLPYGNVEFYAAISDLDNSNTFIWKSRTGAQVPVGFPRPATSNVLDSALSVGPMFPFALGLMAAHAATVYSDEQKYPPYIDLCRFTLNALACSMTRAKVKCVDGRGASAVERKSGIRK